MKKLHLLLFALLASLSFVACSPDDVEGGIETPHERIIFTLLNAKEPAVAAPDEEVTYRFKLSYSEGIASASTSLNGEVLAGSEEIWDNSAEPQTEVEYSFTYTVKGAQFGETLDFVFTAVAANGYTQSVDYALWITANAVEFTVTLPEGLPTNMYSDGTLDFNVNVECGNILKSIEVFKNDGETAYASKSDFTDEKTYSYPFTYTPAEEDVATDVTFRFVATDVKDNTAEASYTISIIKADAVGKMLWSEDFNTSMSISTTTAFDTIEGGITTNAKTEFVPSNIEKYGSLYITDPDTNEQVAVEGALEGCKVYDDDLTALTYTSDGTDVCLSKYEEATDKETKFMTGGYLWYRKAKGGWFRVDGIKLHGATSLKLTYSQSAQKIKVDYSLDGGTTWVELGATEGSIEVAEHKFTLSESAETISLRFTENGGTGHVRIDNLKLVEVL